MMFVSSMAVGRQGYRSFRGALAIFRRNRRRLSEACAQLQQVAQTRSGKERYRRVRNHSLHQSLSVGRVRLGVAIVHIMF